MFCNSVYLLVRKSYLACAILFVIAGLCPSAIFDNPIRYRIIQQTHHGEKQRIVFRI